VTDFPEIGYRQRFYKHQKFVSLDDAKQKITIYNTWGNTRIKTCLEFRSPIQTIAEWTA